MADSERIESLEIALNDALELQNKELISRQEWGTINFSNAENDIDRIFSIISHLNVLPLHYLTDQAIEQISNQLENVVNKLNELDEFDIEKARPTPTELRDNLVQTIHQQADQFYTVATPWIPYLAYQKGDVASNITNLTKSVKDAEQIVGDAKEDIKTKSDEIDTIISKAREASAAAGAAVFTKDFLEESNSLKRTADTWLKITAGFAATTTIAAAATWYLAQSGLDNSQLIQKFGSKVALIAILFTATVWCGNIYRALMHQSSANKHRALSLQTFQAFSSAAADTQTKEAVLLEATKTIFSNTPSGYIDPKSSENSQEIRILEVAKSPSILKAADSGASSSGS